MKLKSKKRIRLLVDAHSFDSGNFEGITTHIAGLYRAMTGLAPHIDFYFAAGCISRVRDAIGNRENTHFIQIPEAGRLKRMLTLFPKIIKGNNIDIAHFQYTIPLHPGCRTIVTTHDILFKDFKQDFPLSYRIPRSVLFRNAVRHADIVCTVSDYSAGRISHHFGIKREDITVTPNAVDPDMAQISPIEVQRIKNELGVSIYLLYVGRFEPRKRHVDALRLFERLRLWEQGYSLVLAGHRSLPVPEFDEALAALPSEARKSIVMPGGVNHSRLKNLYAGASLFIYPSQAEGFGIPPLEAAIAGTPVVCNNNTALSDFSFFGSNLTDFGNTDNLDKLVTRNLNNIDKTQLQFIRTQVIEKYSWEKSAATLLSKIDDLFSRP